MPINLKIVPILQQIIKESAKILKLLLAHILSLICGNSFPKIGRIILYLPPTSTYRIEGDYQPYKEVNT